jgi:predicted ATPase
MTAADALGYPAIQLFVERAKAVVDEFELNDHNASIVSEICRRLDGIPLAIEMAASRVNAFALNELAAQLNNRFSILSRGVGPPRNGTKPCVLHLIGVMISFHRLSRQFSAA